MDNGQNKAPATWDNNPWRYMYENGLAAFNNLINGSKPAAAKPAQTTVQNPAAAPTPAAPAQKTAPSDPTIEEGMAPPGNQYPHFGADEDRARALAAASDTSFVDSAPAPTPDIIEGAASPTSIAGILAGMGQDPAKAAAQASDTSFNNPPAKTPAPDVGATTAYPGTGVNRNVPAAPPARKPARTRTRTRKQVKQSVPAPAPVQTPAAQPSGDQFTFRDEQVPVPQGMAQDKPVIRKNSLDSLSDLLPYLMMGYLGYRFLK
jgi:hypothetical protein